MPHRLHCTHHREHSLTRIKQMTLLITPPYWRCWRRKVSQETLWRIADRLYPLVHNAARVTGCLSVDSLLSAATTCGALTTILRSVNRRIGLTQYRIAPPGSRVRNYVRQEAEGTVQRLRQAQRRDAGLPFVDIIADIVGTQEPLFP